MADRARKNSMEGRNSEQQCGVKLGTIGINIIKDMTLEEACYKVIAQNESRGCCPHFLRLW
jgi:hypothetical protein